MVTWAEVSRHFAQDGAWRDVLIPGSELADWERFIETVRTGAWDFEYRIDGEPAPLPTSLVNLSDEESRLLRIQVLENGLNCHLWIDGEIELDFIPTDIRGQRDIDLLGEFCGQLASVVGRPVTVTHENCPDDVILTYEPNRRAPNKSNRV
jgi:hypothetical protein